MSARRLKLSPVGQGTWALEKAPRAEARRALRRGVELGLAHIDTAEMYGAGRVEELVGEALRGVRRSVFLASKVLPSNATYKGTLRACERSLRRLRTDYLDLYLLHWREKDTALEEAFRAFRRLREDGKIRHYGVSNFGVKDLEEAVAIAGEGNVFCNQVLYHLKERAIEHAVLPWCAARGIALVAYSPLGAGKFPRRDKVLRDIAKAHGVSVYAAALGFLLREKPVFAIPKAARVEHVEENVRAAGLELSEEEVRRLEGAFPRGPEKPLPMT